MTSPWLTVDEAAARLRVSTKTIYREVQCGRLRAARIGGRRSLRFLSEWLDSYAIATSKPVEERRTS
jgi:excisionase family DNA binding protein